MAKSAATAPAANMDDTQDDQTDDASGEGQEDEGGDQNQPTVIATILDNHDGTYTLIHGDEDDDEDEGGESGEGEGGDDETASAPGGEEGTEPGAAPGEDESKGQTYDNPGELLKGVLECIKGAQAATGGSEDDHMQAGFESEGGAKARY